MGGAIPAQTVRSRHSDRRGPSVLRYPSCSRSAATGGFLIGDRLDDLEVHCGARLDAVDFAGDLCPMPEFGGIASCPAARSSSLRLAMAIDRIGCGQSPCIVLPAAADFAAVFDPLPQESDYGRPRRDARSSDWGIHITQVSTPNGMAAPSKAHMPAHAQKSVSRMSSTALTAMMEIQTEVAAVSRKRLPFPGRGW